MGVKRKPKTRVRARISSRIQWDKLGRVAFVVVIVVVLTSYLGPLSSFWKQYNAEKRAKAELNQLAQENRGLKLKLLEQNDPRSVEAQARTLGMVRPGEQLFIIKGLTKSQ